MEFQTRADWLKHVRATLGWSQEALAGQLGVTRMAVAQWENGYTEVPNRTVALFVDNYSDMPPAPAPRNGSHAQVADRRASGQARYKVHVDHPVAPPSPSRAHLNLFIDTYPGDAIPKEVLTRWLEAL